MAYESFSVSELIPVDAERIYAAWLDSAAHSAFTGEAATIEPFVGGKHTAFDGYAVGSTVELLPGRRIVQTWRATDFPPGTPDSRVEVTLEATVGGTMVTIFHTEIPAGRSDQYRDGWLKFYLEALKGYFTRPEARPSQRTTNGVSAAAASTTTKMTAPKTPTLEKKAKVETVKKIAAKKTAAPKPATKKITTKPASTRTKKAKVRAKAGRTPSSKPSKRAAVRSALSRPKSPKRRR